MAVYKWSTHQTKSLKWIFQPCLIDYSEQFTDSQGNQIAYYGKYIAPDCFQIGDQPFELYSIQCILWNFSL